MSAALDVYLYGMTVLSTLHRVALDAPTLDGYGEILESHVCPGGEAMNGALVLSSLGLKTALGGPHWGTETARNLGQYAARAGIDVKKNHCPTCPDDALALSQRPGRDVA